MPWSPSEWDDQKYAKARRLLADGGLSPGKAKEIEQKIAIYESEQGVEGGDTSVSGIRPEDHAPVPVGAPQPPVPPTAPKPGPQGYWKPARPLGTRDFIPEDTGGSLAVWRETPYEVFRQKVLEPQAQADIAAGDKARMEIQRFGPQAFSPQDFALRVEAIAKAHKAQQLLGAEPIDSQEQADLVKGAIAVPGTDQEQLPKLQAGLEVYEAYKAFNDGEFGKAVAARQQDPNAGPIQRLSQLPSKTFAEKAVHATEGIKETLKAGGQGLLSAFTGGLSREMPENMSAGGAYALQGMAPPGLVPPEERLPVPKRDEDWHNRPIEHPVANAIGAGVGNFLPGSAGGTLAKVAFNAGAPAGRYAGAALAGGLTSAAEGGVGDVVSGDTEGLGTRTLGRLGVGAGAGVLGQGVADLGRGLANKISESAIRSPQARTPYEFTEQQGWTYDPILGPRPPAGVKAQAALTRETGVPWAERFADKAEEGVVAGADLRHIAEQASMKKENLAYFLSVKNERPVPITNLNRAASKIVGELEGVDPGLASQITGLVRGFSPVMTPQKMGDAITRLSGLAKAADKGSDELRASAMKRLQAALMEDMKNLPKGNLEGRLAEGPNGETLEGWPALRQEHGDRAAAIDQYRQHLDLTKEGARLPYDVGGIRANLMEQGKRGFPVVKEQVLDKFMPPELKQESLMLRAANMVQDIETGNVAPYPSQAGVVNWIAGKTVPRAYGLGRVVSRPPDSFPISDKMFQWLNARIPRATLALSGMPLPQIIQQRLEMETRPKRFGDLTPEQQQALLSMISTPDTQQEAAP